jgi:hypothetical protein
VLKEDGRRIVYFCIILAFALGRRGRGDREEWEMGVMAMAM